MMRQLTLITAALAAMASLAAAQQQHDVARIEQMPAIPQPYQMRDWRTVTHDYVSLVLNQNEGEHMPLSRQLNSGNNYTQYHPLQVDTYVGWNAHGQGCEAINAIPAVVSAYLTGCHELSSYDLAEGIIDFFNAKNGQNVFLNSSSAQSGNDWWYDVMPNVYFYQLYQLAPMPDADLALWQYRSVADQWLRAVVALGGDTYSWTVPKMGYRAFNLSTMQPLASGVIEPESAGSIAWLLFHAYIETGDKSYLRGAELSMEYLNSLGSNPAYELQLAYGVQASAKMNALLGTAYRTTKLFDNCFDRGYLRGWGSIVGTWGGYDVAGLIGEDNDKGNDYAFVMNGFQQAAALAPAVKYDKRLARAFGRWMVNLANASRLFYHGFLPEANAEAVSYQWSQANDPNSVIPYEAIKETWGGVSPYAMGDAIGGSWASTNLSLYSGSSVGYLAAVVATTNVEAILQLDLNATDFDRRAKWPTYLYYNPYADTQTVELSLPAGSWRIYDAITETSLTQSATAAYSLSIPADGVRLVTLLPADVELLTSDNRLMAGDVVVDYHVGYDFEARLRIKNVEAEDAYPVAGSTLNVKATVGGVDASCAYSWAIDGTVVAGQNATSISVSTAGLSLGEHTVTFTATNGAATVSESTVITVVATPIDVPKITSLSVDASMPVAPGTAVAVTCQLANANQPTDISWHATGGTVEADSQGTSAIWHLPIDDGAYSITCTAANVKGSDTATAHSLVRGSAGGGAKRLLYFPFDGDLADKEQGAELTEGDNVAASYVDGHYGSALALEGNWLYLPNSPSITPTSAITLSFWINPQKRIDSEQFIVSHGSWQDRYKVSITPDNVLRWTVKTNERVADIDSPNELALGSYEHFCAIYTGFSLELWHNGELCAFTPMSGTLGSTSEPLTVGAMTATEPNYNYNGYVDELQMYDGYLSPADIAQVYADGSTGLDEIELSTGATPKFFIANGSICCNMPDVEVVSVYTIDGRTVAAYAPGFYIVAYRRRAQLHAAKVLLAP